jgi:prolyl 4-hydroxylase
MSDDFERLLQRHSQGDKAATGGIVALAEAGDPQALVKASEFRLRGIAGPIDMQAAKALVDQAAATGHPEARRAQAYYVASGIGTRADPGKARKMLEEVAATDRFAAVQLAFLDHVKCGARLPAAKRHVLSADPHVELIEALFSPEECRYVQMLAQPWLEPARVYSQAGGSRVDPIRDAENMAFPPATEDLVIQAINHCIAQAANLPFNWGEPLHVMRYLPGQQFRPHHDSHGPGTGKRRRVATALLYLNTHYEGGATDFPKLGIKVRGGIGDLLVFRNVTADNEPDMRLVHAGLPVLKGQKWLATRWIRGTDFFRR